MKTAAKDFKMTELGPIPKDWEVKRLGELGDVVTGSTPPRGDAECWGGNFDWISAKDFRGKYIVEAEETITEKGKSFCRLLPSDSVLVTCIASIGLNAIAKRPCATNQQINAVICKTCDNEFLYYQIEAAKKRMMEMAGQTAVPIINKGDFENLLVSLPPLPEQRKIAAALSDVDEMIAALEKLIEKKRKIKTGAMQRLLTGKTRLPGFKGAWVEKRLGEVGDFVGGGTPSTSRSDFWNGGVPWFTPAEIGNKKYVERSERTISQLGLKNSAAVVLPVGAILLTTRATIGLTAVLKSPAATNQGFQSLVVDSNNDSEFVYYLLSTVRGEMESRATGSTFLEISSSKLKGIEIVLPPTLAEQKAIAKVLGDMDEEIAALEAELAKTRQLKQGMMQELLTGKVRLV